MTLALLIQRLSQPQIASRAPSLLSPPLRFLGLCAYAWSAWQSSGLASDSFGAPFRDFFLNAASGFLNAPFAALAPASPELLISSADIPTVLGLFENPQLFAPRALAFAFSSSAVVIPVMAMVALADRFLPGQSSIVAPEALAPSDDSSLPLDFKKTLEERAPPERPNLKRRVLASRSPSLKARRRSTPGGL